MAIRTDAQVIALDADETDPATMYDPALTYYADGTRVVMRARGQERRGVTFGRTKGGAVYGSQAVRWDDGGEDLVAPHVLSWDEDAERSPECENCRTPVREYLSGWQHVYRGLSYGCPEAAPAEASAV
jgi:hypothetical protein